MHFDQDIYISISILAQPAQVWNTITNPERIREWLSEDGNAQVRSDWKTGSALQFYGEWHGVDFRDKASILTLEHKKRFTYNYLGHFSGLSDVPENYAILDFQLSQDKEGTLLSFHASNLLTYEIYAHANLYWRVTLNVIKTLAEKDEEQELKTI